jgi:hypothetical protein
MMANLRRRKKKRMPCVKQKQALMGDKKRHKESCVQSINSESPWSKNEIEDWEKEG